MCKACMFPGLAKATQLSDLLILCRGIASKGLRRMTSRVDGRAQGPPSPKRIAISGQGFPLHLLGFPSPFKDAPISDVIELFPPLL